MRLASALLESQLPRCAGIRAERRIRAGRNHRDHVHIHVLQRQSRLRRLPRRLWKGAAVTDERGE